VAGSLIIILLLHAAAPAACGAQSPAHNFPAIFAKKVGLF
jgi:hypothetical protein